MLTADVIFGLGNFHEGAEETRLIPHLIFMNETTKAESRDSLICRHARLMSDPHDQSLCRFPRKKLGQPYARLTVGALAYFHSSHEKRKRSNEISDSERGSSSLCPLCYKENKTSQPTYF